MKLLQLNTDCMKTTEQHTGKVGIPTSSSGVCLISGRERIQNPHPIRRSPIRQTQQKQIIINSMKLHVKTADEKNQLSSK